MNSKRKMHRESPLRKCRTERINSEQKKIIKGTFVATLNIEDVCDETSSMESGTSWITEMETSKSQETIDDVFDGTTVVIPETKKSEYPQPEESRLSDSLNAEEVLTSPETLRRTSEKQQDEWSLDHLNEGSVTSPERGTMDDILSTPERCQSQNSEVSPNGINSTLKTIAPSLDAVLPDFEEIAEKLHDKYIAKLEYKDRTKRSKLSQKSSQECHKGIFQSTTIASPERNPSRRFETVFDDISSISSITSNTEMKNKHDLRKKSTLSKESSQKCHKEILLSTTIASPQKNPSRRFETIFDDISSISSITSNTEMKSKRDSKEKSTLTKEITDIFFKELSKAQSCSKTQRQKSSQANELNKDVPKGYSFETLPVSSEKPKTLHSVTLIPSNKCMKALRKARKKGDLYETPKGTRVNKMLKRKILLDGSLRLKTSKENNLTKLKKRKGFNLSASKNVLSQNSSDKIATKSSEECAPIPKSRESTKAPSLGISGENPAEIVEAPLLGIFGENQEEIVEGIPGEYPEEIVEGIPGENPEEIVEETVINGTDQSKETATTKYTKKRHREEKMTQDSFKERSLPTEISVAAVQDLEPAESVDSWCMKTAEKQSNKSLKGAVTGDVRHSKKSSTNKLKKKKRFQKRKSKYEILDQNTSTARSSIKDFVVSSESEESTTIHSRNTPESNWEKFLKGTAVIDSLKIAPAKRQKGKKRVETNVTDESLQEEIISTPSNTTIPEDSIEYMDDTESRRTTSEERSEERFLEEMGLYESSCSTKKGSVEINKGKAKEDSWDQKTLQEKLIEYKEYLNTLPICDLSLKKWRDKKEGFKYQLP